MHKILLFLCYYYINQILKNIDTNKLAFEESEKLIHDYLLKEDKHEKKHDAYILVETLSKKLVDDYPNEYLEIFHRCFIEAIYKKSQHVTRGLLTLDVDDFNNIKDLTRIKAGLTAEGIVILEDYKEIFKIALDKFNEGRGKDAIKKIKNDINNETQNSTDVEENEKITFLKNVIDILKNKYEIDSQGIYEYIKEIVDVSIGPESRKKVWKEIDSTLKEEGENYVSNLGKYKAKIKKGGEIAGVTVGDENTYVEWQFLGTKIENKYP